MKSLRKPVYLVCGDYTMSFGTGRKEFNPKKSRPGLEHYIAEAGQAVVGQLPDPTVVDEGYVGNFMAARFNHQGHLGAMFALVHPSFEYKPSTRVEGACCSGGLSVASAVKSVLADASDVVLALGVEVQNTVKAIYGADILAGAGHYAGERKNGHAYFFPAKFSDRAGAYKERFGEKGTWEGMGRWYEQAIVNARTNEKAQEFQNADPDPFATHQAMKPNGKSFCDHINVLDCSKVSDGAAGILVASAVGLARAGKTPSEAVQLVGIGHAVADLTTAPQDLTKLTTSQRAVEQALAMAGLTIKDIGVFDIHDCFTITGILTVEALGLAPHGEGAAYVAAGKTRRDGPTPMNTTGGLVGWGHPTGASGVRQIVDVYKQLTGKAGSSQIQIPADRPYGLTISMGGNDRTVVACVLRRAA
ncbi:MAG: 3-ketoacyl-CoA thiolase [Acidobacteria bacterium]|jgi:acetyl-CoA C-acetyltransferase/acetyl-CoA acyltransferase|nr:3-ketoacyl-CoA thiolase [Acidobacteriota bacterium]